MGNNCFKSHDEGEFRPECSLRGNMLWEQKNRNVKDVYDVIKVVGEGSISTISKIKKKGSAIGGSARSRGVNLGCFGRVVGKKSKKEVFYALKNIDLRRVDDYIDELRNEIRILKELDHPNIVKAYETFERKNNIFIVMELCTGGDLYARSPYREKEAVKIVGKLLSAVAYMHENNIIHRDLKFENIMFENKNPDAEIKVIDFGLSKKYLSKSRLFTDRVGTLYTMAPDVIEGPYTSKADLWSVGVISFMLLSNTKPFWGKSRKRIVIKIMECEYNFESSQWKHVSKEAKEFVSSLLKLNPDERLDAEQALQSLWLQKEFQLSDRRPEESIMDEINENIIRYADSGEFKKMALMVIAHKSPSEEIFKMRQAFDQYDSANNGCISYKEFKEALAHLSYSEEELDAMFRGVATNEHGVIFYTEFLAATLEAQGNIEEERLAEAFDRIDSDNSGFITKKNLRDMLGTEYTKDRVDKLIKEADVDKDGRISYDEFLISCRRQKNEEIKRIYKLGGFSSSSSRSISDHYDEKTSIMENV